LTLQIQIVILILSPEESETTDLSGQRAADPSAQSRVPISRPGDPGRLAALSLLEPGVSLANALPEMETGCRRPQ